jgi:hypothetical protein
VDSAGVETEPELAANAPVLLLCWASTHSRVFCGHTAIGLVYQVGEARVSHWIRRRDRPLDRWISGLSGIGAVNGRCTHAPAAGVACAAMSAIRA